MTNVKVGDVLLYCFGLPGPDIDELLVVEVNGDNIVCDSSFLERNVDVQASMQFDKARDGYIRLRQWVVKPAAR